MGPVELIFLVLLAVFAVIGLVRGYGRELGVTTMLLIALLVLELIDERYHALFNKGLAIFVSGGEPALTTARALIYVGLLILITYVSYEGQTLSFPGNAGRRLLDLGAGLLNGYLFAGSVWYYLHQANWPLFHVSPNYTAFYLAVVRFLPPAVFSWQYLLALVVIMLIAKVWK